MSTNKYDAVMAMSYVPSSVTTAAIYGTATSVVIDLRGFKEKNLLVKNTGANGLTWNILASLDDGATYDVTLKADNNVAAANQELYASSVYYTHWKIQLKDQVAASHTTVTVKLAAIGA